MKRRKCPDFTNKTGRASAGVAREPRWRAAGQLAGGADEQRRGGRAEGEQQQQGVSLIWKKNCLQPGCKPIPDEGHVASPESQSNPVLTGAPVALNKTLGFCSSYGGGSGSSSCCDSAALRRRFEAVKFT
jgi:hypothetical protein